MLIVHVYQQKLNIILTNLTYLYIAYFVDFMQTQLMQNH